LRLRVSETIAAPRDRVFAKASDIDRMLEWLPDCPRFEKLTPGPLRLGTRYLETRIVLGREDTEEYEVTLLEPPRRIEVRADGRKGTAGRGVFRFVMELEAEPMEVTRATLTGEVTGMGIAGVLLGPLIRRILRRTMARDLAALKAWIEGQAPG
jgi:carbon monoxide dehydrogenase subunit G